MSKKVGVLKLHFGLLDLIDCSTEGSPLFEVEKEIFCRNKDNNEKKEVSEE